jgi:hypothetical protein
MKKRVFGVLLVVMILATSVAVLAAEQSREGAYDICKYDVRAVWVNLSELHEEFEIISITAYSIDGVVLFSYGESEIRCLSDFSNGADGPSPRWSPPWWNSLHRMRTSDNTAPLASVIRVEGERNGIIYRGDLDVIDVREVFGTHPRQWDIFASGWMRFLAFA